MVRSPRHAAHAIRGAIQDLRSKAREKLAVAELARELAHELNNPLEALTNLVYLARQEPLDEEVKAMLDEAEAQLARLSVVVDTILNLEKISHEQRLRTAGTLVDTATFLRIKQKYESALHLASIIEGAQDAIYSKKLDTTIMAWNQTVQLSYHRNPERKGGMRVILRFSIDSTCYRAATLESLTLSNLQQGGVMTQRPAVAPEGPRHWRTFPGIRHIISLLWR